MDIEEAANIERWDFRRTKEIFSKPMRMKLILDNFSSACLTAETDLEIENKRK